MRATSEPSYRTPPPPRRDVLYSLAHTFFFAHVNFYAYIFLRVHNFFSLENFHPFLDYLRLGLFTWKITCEIFYSNSGNITHSPLEFDPLITNMVVPLRGDVPVRSCAAPKVPVENVWAKYTSKIFIFQTWQYYISKDSPQRALSKSQRHQHVKM